MRKNIGLNTLGATQKENDKPLVWLGAMLLLALPVAILWWLRRRQNIFIPISQAPLSPGTAKQPELEPDDLTRIKGIGPKVQACLESAGITTFAGLANKSSDQLKEILQSAGLFMVNPQTWPEQANLAAQREWEAS